MSEIRAVNMADAFAGLSLAGLLLPEAVAYSGLANLPPQAGVIGLLAGLLCYALVGRSRYAIVSATSSSAAVFAAAPVPSDSVWHSPRYWCARPGWRSCWPAVHGSAPCRT
jgi:MFS superfamily sulfate permease-like transporter